MRPSASIKRLQPCVRVAGHPNRVPLREFIPVGDVTDCLSAAYECVSRAANGQVIGQTLRECAVGEDACKARNQKIPWLMVDVQSADRFIYALASVPRCAAKDVSIGLEPGWLAILAEPEDFVRASGERARAGGETAAEGPMFCLMSLPSEIDPLETMVVLAKGILGIRMRKARSR
jgi:hypothetical protein